jgi:hypothetical protein
LCDFALRAVFFRSCQHPTFFHGNTYTVVHKFWQKSPLATFWATFSQDLLVTLVARDHWAFKTVYAPNT